MPQGSSCMTFAPSRPSPMSLTAQHRPVSAPSRLVTLMGFLFFIIGVMTWLNGPLIAFSRLSFSLDDNSTFLIPTVFYSAHLLGAFPCAWVTGRVGAKSGMMLALLGMAGGCVGFAACSAARFYPGGLAALFLTGCSVTLLGITINPYVTGMGPFHTAARRIAIMGLCNKAAGIIAPVIFGKTTLRALGSTTRALAVTTDPGQRAVLISHFAHQIVVPYLVLAVGLAITALSIRFISLPPLHFHVAEPQATSRPATDLQRRWRPQLWLGAACLFLYVGVEAIAGDAIGTYGDHLGLDIDNTKFFTSLTFCMMIVGYVCGLIMIPRVMSQLSYLAFAAAVGVILSGGAVLTTGMTSVLCMAALGFSDAMMWPSLYPVAIEGLGRRTLHGTAITVMAVSGGAVLPKLFVWLATTYGFTVAFGGILIPSYLFILSYALWAARRDVPATRERQSGNPVTQTPVL
ncbi:glucose/galactose MFS transporter [Novacetimonas cocois]|uniref:Glucose/galactose MFS transporter n=2 Tax=Novacetimonas cocois TaxID=1747507 RepID=A0A365YYS5_9PROT|nr:glucose/galactose MFS transporter [Novacetimonas cocois]